MDPKRGLTVVEIIHAIHDDQIKAMYIMGENPAMSDPDQIHTRKALAKLRSFSCSGYILNRDSLACRCNFTIFCSCRKNRNLYKY